MDYTDVERNKKNVILKMFPLLAAFLVNGMIAVMTGIVLKNIYMENGIGYDLVGIAVAIQSVTNMVGGLVSSRFIHQTSQKSVLSLFCILFSAFGILTVIHSLYFTYVIMAVTGFAWGLCNHIIHTILIAKFGNYKISISALHTSYAVGSFAGPFIIAFFGFFHAGWRIPVILTAVLSILLLPFLYPMGKGKRIELTEQDCKEDIPQYVKEQELKLWKDSYFWMCIGLYFGYVGIEVSINSWMVIFLEYHKAFSDSIAQIGISLVWLIIIFSRMGCIYFRKKFSNEVILAVQCVGMFISLLLVIMVHGQMLTFAALVLLGLVMGGISPSNAENAKAYLNERSISGGVILAAGGMGSMFLPLIISAITRTYSVYYGMFFILLFSGLITLLAIVNQYKQKRRRTQ